MAPIGVAEVELWLRRDGEDVLASADGGDERRVRLGLEEALWMPHELTPRRFARGAGRVHDTARSLAALGDRASNPARSSATAHAAQSPAEPLAVRPRPPPERAAKRPLRRIARQLPCRTGHDGCGAARDRRPRI